MALRVYVIPVFTEKAMTVDMKMGDIVKYEEPFEKSIMLGIFTALKFLILLGLCTGALVVVYGFINFMLPKGIRPGDMIPPRGRGAGGGAAPH